MSDFVTIPADDLRVLALVAIGALVQAALLLWFAWALLFRRGLRSAFSRWIERFSWPEYLPWKTVSTIAITVLLLAATLLISVGPTLVAWRMAELLIVKQDSGLPPGDRDYWVDRALERTRQAIAEDQRMANRELARLIEDEHRDLRSAISTNAQELSRDVTSGHDQLSDLVRSRTNELEQQMTREHGAGIPSIDRPTAPGESSSIWPSLSAIILTLIVAGILSAIGLALARWLGSIMGKGWATAASSLLVLTSAVSAPLALHLLKNPNFEVTLLPIMPDAEINFGDGGKGDGQLERELRIEIQSPDGNLDCNGQDLLIASFVKNWPDKLEGTETLSTKVDRALTVLHGRGPNLRLAALVLIGSADQERLNKPPLNNDQLAEARAEWVAEEIKAKMRSSPLTIGLPRIVIENGAAPQIRLSLTNSRDIVRAVQICALWGLN